jgi:hypothetical protein
LILLDLTTPTDHAGAYEWLTVLMAHSVVGVVLTAAMAAFFDWAANGRGGTGFEAWFTSALCYGLLWEVIIQGVGAGWADAGVDTFAVACGGLIGLLIWDRRGALIAGTIGLFAVVAAIGIRGRK